MPLALPPLRIVLVCLHTSPYDDPGAGDVGGMNVAVRQTAEALAYAGHTVDILTRRSGAEQPPAMQVAPRLTLRFLDAGPAERRPKSEHEDFIDEFHSQMSALPAYDIVHSHHWFSGMAALPFARSRGIPHVQSFHSIAAAESTPLSEGERPESPGRLAGEAWLARESDAIIAVSRAEAGTVVRRLGAETHRVAVVPPGVETLLFRPAERKPPSGPGYAVVAARLEPLKGLDLAIRAIAAVPAAIRPELVIAGGPTSGFDGYVGELRALAERCGITDGVRFIGSQSRGKLAALLREARLVLVPSHSETYGLIALEGAASGVPVVAAAAGGLREAVDDGVTGVLLESRDPQSWADAITLILSDPGYARRLSLAARESATGLRWTRSARGYLEVYRTLLARAEEESALDGRHRVSA